LRLLLAARSVYFGAAGYSSRFPLYSGWVGTPLKLFMADSTPCSTMAETASAALSRDAGRYLCNYLCWRASEAASAPRGPRLVAFIHVPNVRPGPALPSRRRLLPRTLSDLIGAGEAIMLAVLAAARGGR